MKYQKSYNVHQRSHNIKMNQCCCIATWLNGPSGTYDPPVVTPVVKMIKTKVDTYMLIIYFEEKTVILKR